MSFKHLFEKAQTLKSLSNQSADEVGSAIESAEYQKQDIIKERRFIPAVDYTTASNFARYGSAEKYYGESLDRIYKTYPYDGSLRERLKWENESTEIDLYILNNLYPRRTGYGLMSAGGWGTRNGSLGNGYGLPNTLEYIYFKGGPHPNPDGMSPLNLQFTGSNFYDTGSNRTSNLKYDLSGDGVTVEFWMKKDAYASSLTTKEVIFDMWNGATEGLAHYGRLSLALNSSNEGAAVFTATLLSGSDGVSESSIGSAVTIADSTWHHYAFSFKNATAGITSRVYIDGALNQESTLGSDALNEVTGAMQATLGALATTLGGGAQYAGKLSASLDEFRYWKTQRSSQDVGRFWFTQVGGGVNSDPQTFKDTTEVANTTLGVYYKFNEGITGTSSIDNNVLDYSGRVSNGAWTGYTSDSRNTGSAIISSSAAIKEFEDPIIYSFDPAVVALRAGLIQSGSDHDASNAASIYKSIPAWITEEDVERGSQLHNVTQIMASYLDTLHLQIESLNKLKDINYVSGSDKVSVFSERLLMSTGLVSPELFVDATVLEKLGDRSEDRVFEKNITEIKNQIYQNIYNNLSYIYKTKGTEKSFRNLIRCFGIDDELIKINMYANNAEFDFTTNRKNQSYGKKYVNFNSIRSMDANVFQFRDPGDATNTYGFISSSTNLTGGFAFTMEADVLFPEKFDQSHDFYQDTNIISCSLFGVHATTAQSSDTAGSENAQTDTAFPTDDATNFQVYAVRETKDSPNVTFILKSSAGGKVPTLTSSMYYDVYDNNQWNFAVKISPSRYPWTAYVPTAPIADYDIEFQGVNVDAGVVVNSFNVTGTATAPGAAFITGSRRAFVGAHRTNMTGTVLQRCDAKIGSCRLWLDKLSQETIKAHALDPTNYGLADTGLYAFPFQATASYGDLPRINTLMLNWDFNQNTGSSAAGSFRVADLSSGSATMASTRNDWLGNILYYQHPGSGSNFSASTSTVVDKEYVVASKQNLPESLESSDMITVLSQQDQVEFTRDSRPLNYFLAFEKSMQQSISDQMINYFATLTDLNTIIGAPVNRYRGEYKGLKLLRQRFFEGVSNSEIDFEKFFEYYKWIDGALSVLLGQLAPISLDFDPNIRTLIESHILERSKYQNKFPFLAQSDPDITGSIGTVATPITVNSIINDAQGTGIESAQAPTKRVTGMPNTSVLNSWKYDHAPLGSTTPTPLSLLFDGTDEYVDIGNGASVWEPLIGGAGDAAKPYSVSFWYKRGGSLSTPANPYLYSFGTGKRSVFLYTTSDGSILASNSSNNVSSVRSSAVVAVGVWTHITVTFDGDVDTGETEYGVIKVYINGVNNTNPAYATPASAPEAINSAVSTIGVRTGSQEAAGNYCDFAVWDKELSSAEVTEIYGGGDRVKLSTSTCQSNLLSWWKLGNGLDDTYTGAGALADEVGGRDGTPTNFDSASDIEADSPDFIANYNGPAQNSKSVWWQNRAGRDLPAFATPDNVDADREVLLNAIKSSNNRTLGRPYRFSGGGSVVLGGVARHPSQRKGVVYEATAPAGPTVGQGTYGAVPSDIMVAKSADVESLISSSDEYFPSQKVRYGFGMGVQSASYEVYERDADGATVAPFSLYSSSISDALSSEMSNFTGSTIITNMHADLASDQTDVPMQGPFTEKFVGGRQHRHIELNQSGSPDSISDPLTMANNFNGLDSRVNRPEGFRVQMGYEFTGSNTGSPWKASSGHLQVVSPQYPELDTAGGTTNLYDRPKANLPRGEHAKRPINIKNILMTTASLSQSMSGTIDHNRIGNYTKNYEVIQTAGRSQNDPYFREGTFTFAPNPETPATRGRTVLMDPPTKSIYFDGSDDYATFGTVAAWEPIVGGGVASQKAFTVSMWIKPTTAFVNGEYIWTFGVYGTGFRRLIYYGTTGKLECTTGAANFARTTSNVVALNTWHHVVVTFAGGALAVPQIYVDGTLASTSTANSTPGAALSTHGFTLSANGGGLGTADGEHYMCDPAVWGRALSAAEVTTLYGEGRRINIVELVGDGLVSWWPLGDGKAILGDAVDTYNGTIHSANSSSWDGTATNLASTAITTDSPMVGGWGPTTNPSGTLDYALPIRTGSNSNQTVIVNRFSAPGGYDVSSQGYMDPAHEEFSVYNALPYRNRTVIDYGIPTSASAPASASIVAPLDQIDHPRGLNQLSTLHCGPFGADSAFGELSLSASQAGNSDGILGDGIVTSASFHKTQRNTKKRLKFTQETRSLWFNNADSDQLKLGGWNSAAWSNLIGGAGSNAESFSVSFWILCTDTTVANGQSIIGDGTSSGNNKRAIYLFNSDDTIRFGINGTQDGVVKSSAITQDRWHHVVCTFAGGDPGGSGTDDYMNIYLDGALDTTVVQQLNGPTDIYTGTTGNIWLGYFANGVDPIASSGYFQGNLSNLAIWDVELSAAEVSRIYNHHQLYDLSKMKIDNLAVWWRFSDSSIWKKPDDGVINHRDSFNIYNVAPKAAKFFNAGVGCDLIAADGFDGYGTYQSLIPASPSTWPIVTGSLYDNLFEQHGVPNADRNYAWVTASLEADVPFYGFDQKIPAPGQTDTPWYIGNKSANWNSANYGLEDADEYARDKWNALIGGPVGAAKAYSYSMWIRPTTMVDSIPKFVSWGGFARYLEIYGAGLPAPLRAYNGPVMGGNYRASSTSLSADTWYHVVVTYEGVYEGNPPNIYINGALDNGAGAATSDPAGFGVYGMSVGASEVNTMDYRGHMCDLAVWTKALSAGEASTIYNNGVRFNLKASNAPDRLVAWWPLGSDPEDISTEDGPLAFYDEVSRQKLVGIWGSGPPIDSSEAPSAELPLYGFYKNTVPKVPEISAYVEPGLQSTSGTIVPGLYPFQGRPSGTYGAAADTATSMNQLYEPPYSSLIDSASVNIAGFAYSPQAMRYANLDTHTLEPPAFQVNRKSLRISGSTLGMDPSGLRGQGPNFVCGEKKQWAQYNAPTAYSASANGLGNSVGPNSAWTVSTWFKILYSGSFANAAGETGSHATASAGQTWPGNSQSHGGALDALRESAPVMALWSWPAESATGLSFSPPAQLLFWPRVQPGTNSSSSVASWVPELVISGGNGNIGTTAPGTDLRAAATKASMWITASSWDLKTGVGGPFLPHTWYHLAVSYDGTDPSCMLAGGFNRDYSAVKMYVNGVSMLNNGQITSGALLNPSSGNSGLTFPAPQGQGPVVLGNAGNNHIGYPFNGLVNELQVYNKALSTTEVTELYNRRGTLLGGFTAESNLTNWYRMGNAGSRATNVFIEDVKGGAHAINTGLTGSDMINPAGEIVSDYLGVWAHPVTGAWGAKYGSGSNEYRFISGSRLSDSFVTFNHAMLNLNGPYQHPSWKQVRTEEHPVARRLRRANRISIADPPPMVPQFVAGGTNAINFLRAKSSNTSIDYVEQPIDTRYRPFVAAFEDRSESPDRGNNVSLQVSYGNNIGYFSNNGLNNRLSLRPDTRSNQAFNEVQDYIDKTGDADIAVYASYGERVYPRSVNAYQTRVRTRADYSTENVWNKSRVLRSGKFLNSQGMIDYSMPNAPATGTVLSAFENLLGYVYNSYLGAKATTVMAMDPSPWPLDAPQKYTLLTSSTGLGSGTYSPVVGQPGQNTASIAQVVSGALPAIITGSVPFALFSGENQLGKDVSSLTENMILAGTGSGGGELQNTYSYFFSAMAGGSIFTAMSNSCRPAASYIRPLPETPARIQGTYPLATAQLVPANYTLMGFHPWVAPLQEDLDPYRPYQDYAENLRLAGKDCSIVPEYRISEHLETYLGNEFTEPATDGFLAKLGNLLDLTGSSLDSSTKDFYSVYATTDFLELFRVVDNDLRGPRGKSEDDNIVRHGTTLQATAFTSFLPYKGFYPAERTVKLSSYFSQSMGSLLPGTRSSPDFADARGGTVAPAATPNETLSRILLEPLFSPGILFNTIKSGIAVGNYVIRNTASNPGDLKQAQYCDSYEFAALGALGIAAKRPGSETFGAASVSASAWASAGETPNQQHWGILEGYSEFNFNSSASYQSSSVNSASFACLNVGHSASAGIKAFMPVRYRAQARDDYNTLWTSATGSRFGYYLQKIPFDAIRRPQDYLSARALASGSDVAEAPDWLGGVLANTASSTAAEPEGGLGAGWLYDTGVSMSSSIAASVRIPQSLFGFSNPSGGYDASGSLFDTMMVGTLKNQSQNKIRWNGNVINPIYNLAIDNFLCETVNFFQDGLTSFVSKEEEAFKPVKKNKYYGMRVLLERSADDVGNPTFGMYSRASAFGTPLALSGSRGSGITFSHLTPPYYNGAAYADIVFQAPYSDRPALQDIVSKANVVYSRRIESNLQLSPSGTQASASCIGFVTGSDLKRDHDYVQMQLSASVNIFDKILAIPEGTNQQKVQWVIQTKFETPMFDFYDTPCLPHPTSSAHRRATAGPIDVTSSTAPFQIRGMWHQYGRVPEANKGVFLGVQDLPETYYSDQLGQEIQVESLRDIVGFGSGESKRVGELSTSKTVREAVLVVPFRIARGEREFIKLPPTSIFERSSALAERARSRERMQRVDFWEEHLGRYNRQVELLERYILPPTLDFLINRSVRPIFFDAFEFTETFSSKDLQNMWQNLPPESNQKMRRQSSTINISDFFTDQIFGRTDIQWLVFKVKQRATKDYDILSKRGLTKDIPLVPSSIESPYSFNWPYDYFSLVELLKIDENVEYVSRGAGATPWEDPPPPPRLGASPGSDTTGQSRFVGDYTEAEATAVLNDLNNNQES